jgi:hypothetical protein
MGRGAGSLPSVLRALEDGTMARFLKWHDKDSQARPEKGRTFPLSFASVRNLVVAAKIRKPDGRRAPIAFRNPSASEKREALVATFRPEKEFTLLSVPNELDEAAVLWRSIVEYCGWLARRKTPDRSGHGPVYDFLGGLEGRPLSVVERWYHFQTRKYRSTDKFTGGSNRRLLKVDEYPVQLLRNPRL